MARQPGARVGPIFLDVFGIGVGGMADRRIDLGRVDLGERAPDRPLLRRQHAGSLGLGLFGDQRQGRIATRDDRGELRLIGQQISLPGFERRPGRIERRERLVDLLAKSLGLVRRRCVRRRPAFVQLGQMIEPGLQVRGQMRQPHQLMAGPQLPPLPALLLRPQAGHPGRVLAHRFDGRQLGLDPLAAPGEQAPQGLDLDFLGRRRRERARDLETSTDSRAISLVAIGAVGVGQRGRFGGGRLVFARGVLLAC